MDREAAERWGHFEAVTVADPHAEGTATGTAAEKTDRADGSLSASPSRTNRLLGVDRVERERWGKFKLRDADATSANLLIVLGAALTIVGLVHLGVLWTPTRLGRPSWEFGTLSQTFTNVPLVITGLVLFLYGKVRHPRTHPAWPRRAAVGMVFLAGILVAMGTLYALTLPDVFLQAPASSWGPLIRAIVRNAAEILVYPLLCLMVAVILWSGVEKMR